MRLLALGVSGAVVLGTAASAWAQACAMCGSAFGANDPIGRAFSWSILFLMAAPYVIFGSVGGWLFFTYRRALGRQRAAVVDLDARRMPGSEGSEGDLE
jgi:hypothetical protein